MQVPSVILSRSRIIFCDSIFRQPQLLLLPAPRSSEATFTSLPQEHRHRQMTVPLLLSFSCGYRTVSLPNFFPVRSFLFCPRLRRQPQLCFSPILRLRVEAVVYSPQSHRHFHWTCLFRFCTRSRTLSIPNLSPVRSSAFRPGLRFWTSSGGSGGIALLFISCMTVILTSCKVNWSVRICHPFPACVTASPGKITKSDKVYNFVL